MRVGIVCNEKKLLYTSRSHPCFEESLGYVQGFTHGEWWFSCGQLVGGWAISRTGSTTNQKTTLRVYIAMKKSEQHRCQSTNKIKEKGSSPTPSWKPLEGQWNHSTRDNYCNALRLSFPFGHSKNNPTSQHKHGTEINVFRVYLALPKTNSKRP